MLSFDSRFRSWDLKVMSLARYPLRQIESTVSNKYMMQLESLWAIEATPHPASGTREH